MADIFHEVDEELRREQLKKLWQRYGNLLIAACLLMVAGVGGWRGYEWWQAKRAGASGAAFEHAVSLAEAGKDKEAEAAFTSIATSGTAGYRILARLRAAAELASADRQAAIKAYESVAADPGVERVIRDLADVRAGILLVDSSSYSQMRELLEPLTAPDRTFRDSARELLALSAWKSRDMSAARQWTNMMMTDPNTPLQTRNRAEILSELIAANGKG